MAPEVALSSCKLLPGMGNGAEVISAANFFYLSLVKIGARAGAQVINC